jgi:hypothetical protein
MSGRPLSLARLRPRSFSSDFLFLNPGYRSITVQTLRSSMNQLAKPGFTSPSPFNMRLKTCRRADVQTCRRADVQTCRLRLLEEKEEHYNAYGLGNRSAISCT